MDIRELRIGNVIAFDDGSTDIVRVEYLFCDEDAWFVKWTKISGDGGFNEGNSLLVDFKPIPLTPEILEKAGFETPDCMQSTVKFKDNIMLDFHFGEWKLRDYSRITVRYVHQLQNLYHALTGEELEINL